MRTTIYGVNTNFILLNSLYFAVISLFIHHLFRASCIKIPYLPVPYISFVVDMMNGPSRASQEARESNMQLPELERVLLDGKTMLEKSSKRKTTVYNIYIKNLLKSRIVLVVTPQQEQDGRDPQLDSKLRRVSARLQVMKSMFRYL